MLDVLQEGRKEALKMRRRKEERRVGKIERELRELKEERRKIMKARKGRKCKTNENGEEPD